LDCLTPILKELHVELSSLEKGADDSSYIRCHHCVEFCIKERLIELLLNFIIRLQSWGITSEDPSPSVKVRLQTWGNAMDVLFHLLLWGRVMHEYHPHPSKTLIKCCLASQGDTPGLTKRGKGRRAEALGHAAFAGMIKVTQ
jgi:hypothetical protein